MGTLTLDQALKAGYCIVSRAGRQAARLDRPDWKAHMAAQHANGEQWVKNLGKAAADQYRRVYSKDWIHVPSSWIGKMSNSMEWPSEFQPLHYEAVTFEADTWRAVVNGSLQRPDFQSKGAALAFAQAVAEGKRKAEPIKDRA